jgi:hypothetical protein
MKKVFVANDVKMVGVKTGSGVDKKIDYYVNIPGQGRIYAFTRKYSPNTYRISRAGIRVNELLTTRSKDISVMRLVKYTRYMMEYLVEEYEIPRAA